jgi:hypothetical protein
VVCSITIASADDDGGPIGEDADGAGRRSYLLNRPWGLEDQAWRQTSQGLAFKASRRSPAIDMRSAALGLLRIDGQGALGIQLTATAAGDSADQGCDPGLILGPFGKQVAQLVSRE